MAPILKVHQCFHQPIFGSVFWPYCLFFSSRRVQPRTCCQVPIRLWLRPSHCVSNTSCRPPSWQMPLSPWWTVTARGTLSWLGSILPCSRYNGGKKNSYVLLVFCGQMFSHFATKSRALEVISAINLFFWGTYSSEENTSAVCATILYNLGSIHRIMLTVGFDFHSHVKASTYLISYQAELHMWPRKGYILTCTGFCCTSFYFSTRLQHKQVNCSKIFPAKQPSPLHLNLIIMSSAHY